MCLNGSGECCNGVTNIWSQCDVKSWPWIGMPEFYQHVGLDISDFASLLRGITETQGPRISVAQTPWTLSDPLLDLGM